MSICFTYMKMNHKIKPIFKVESVTEDETKYKWSALFWIWFWKWLIIALLTMRSIKSTAVSTPWVTWLWRESFTLQLPLRLLLNVPHCDFNLLVIFPHRMLLLLSYVVYVKAWAVSDPQLPFPHTIHLFPINRWHRTSLMSQWRNSQLDLQMLHLGTILTIIKCYSFSHCLMTVECMQKWPLFHILNSRMIKKTGCMFYNSHFLLFWASVFKAFILQWPVNNTCK